MSTHEIDINEVLHVAGIALVICERTDKPMPKHEDILRAAIAVDVLERLRVEHAHRDPKEWQAVCTAIIAGSFTGAHPVIDAIDAIRRKKEQEV
jgi:hypothetical protein